MTKHNQSKTLDRRGGHLNCALSRTGCVRVSGTSQAGSSRGADANAVGALEIHQCLRPGDVVHVFRHLVLTSRPIIEGKARLIKKSDCLPDVWLLRFEGEGSDRWRFVPAEWSTDTCKYLRVLETAWRLSQSPLLLENTNGAFDRDAVIR